MHLEDDCEESRLVWAEAGESRRPSTNVRELVILLYREACFS